MSGDFSRRILKGEVRAAAQVLTLIESGDSRARAILKQLYPRTGNAHEVGVTGPVGTGKSSLIDSMTVEFRRRKKEVGILAVDPTSCFTGGALLGDRLRMRNHFLDEGVFIRSLANRGRRGGVSAAMRDTIHLLDAMGKEIIFVETIGAGQDELEIASLTHTVVMVLIPWMGDEVQAMKAGLLEIADILVVNKSDLPGAEETIHQLRGIYESSALEILATSALKNEGIGPLVDTIEGRHMELASGRNHRVRELEICRQELLSLLQEKVFAEALKKVESGSVDKLARQIAERKIDPYTVAERIARGLRL